MEKLWGREVALLDTPGEGSRGWCCGAPRLGVASCPVRWLTGLGQRQTSFQCDNCWGEAGGGRWE